MSYRIGREPSLGEMARNLGEALAEWGCAGFKVATADVARARGEVCLGCELWDEHARLGLGKCKSPRCGCTELKWWLATSRCPEGKW